MIRFTLLALVLALTACSGSATPAEPDCTAAFDECSMAEGALVQGDHCQAEVGPKGHYVDITCPLTVGK